MDGRTQALPAPTEPPANGAVPTSSATGTLLDWTATQSAQVHHGQIVGPIEIQDGIAQVPGAGTARDRETDPRRLTDHRGENP